MADEVAKRFAENLSRCLKQAGYSQEKLAGLSEMHRTQVSELLRGRQLPRLDSLIKLAGALQVEPAELIDGLHFEPAAQHGQFKVSPAKKSG